MNVFPWHKDQLAGLLHNRSGLPHALLIHGRQGIGKAVFARALAQALLCESPADSGAACERCAACIWFESSNHPDFRLIEPAGQAQRTEDEQPPEKKGSMQIVIEQIRELPDFINMSSHRGGLKVVLMQPAEALNANAANALLKSLEEPPPGTCFLLVAHRVHYLLPTIRSRCRHVALPGPDPDAATEWLHAQGTPHPELALAHTGNSPLLAQQLAGQEYWQQRDFFFARITDREFDPLFVAEQVRDYPIQDVVSWLQKWTFDLVFQKFLGKVRYNPDYAAAISALVAHIDTLSVVRFHREMVRLQRIVNHPLNPRLFLELLLLDYAGLLKAGTERASRAG